MRDAVDAKVKDYFDRTYIINLADRVDRQQAVKHELEKAGMPIAPGQVEIFSVTRPLDAGNFPSIGAWGCFQSHLAVLKQAQAERLTNVLVLEDDVSLSEQFVREQPSIVEQLSQNDWGFVYFGHGERLASDRVTLQPFFDPIVTAHCYGINSTIFDRLITFLEQIQQRPNGHPDGGPMHLDGAYSTFRAQNPDILTLIAAPSLAGQRSSRSDISPNRYDRLPVIKQLVGMARAGKQWLNKAGFNP